VRNTIVVSDLHLTEAQTIDERRPLWMSYKRKEFFIDNDFADFLRHLDSNIPGEIELVLNGDTFDFDTVLALPDKEVGWLAEHRGLGSEEWMSLFKMDVIIDDHPTWFDAVKNFIANGNKIVFIVGNHDVELYWPSVQKRIHVALGSNVPSARFCNWFYISEEDSYISHGHQYDPSCVVKDTINPLIQVNGQPYIRIPFGNLAARFMLNGIGWLNPHCPSNYIKNISEYFKLFLRYLRAQPLMVWSWFWSAVVTLVISLRDHWKPPMMDPLLVEEKVSGIAKCSNATPMMVRQLRALQVPSVCTNPINIFRELWLDRGLLLLGLLYLAWQIILHINIAIAISMGWVIIPFIVLLPALMVYASSIKLKVFGEPLLTDKRAEYIAKITKTRRVIFSHTHAPEQLIIGRTEYINSGSWAPAFSEPECKNKINKQIFVWIKPAQNEREAKVYIWPNGD